MPRRQPRWPSIGLDSCSAMRALRAIVATSTPGGLAPASLDLLVGRAAGTRAAADRAGGSSPAGPPWSRRCRRSPRAASAAAWRAPLAAAFASSARIISRTATMRSASKNMCSVRQRPMPSAPKLARGARRRPACRRWCARFRRADLVGPAHQRRRNRRTARAGRVGTAPRMTSPVAPSMVMIVAALDRDVAHRQRAAPCVVDAQRAGAGDAGLAHAARHHGRVAGHAAARGQDALGRVHAVDVLGAGLDAHQDHRLAACAARFSASSAVKTTLPDAAPGEAGRPLASVLALRLRDRACGCSSWSSDGGLDARDRLLLVDQASRAPCRRRSSARPARCACRCGVCSM